ncbi:hypothetical protein COO60DRAFT_1466031 [Scenedesmus sp. NREL 46B-D3]|nr:hypothetical protein COO60DRAFT_1466031 [Scenedesmus sp. NREL 46B-D3]
MPQAVVLSLLLLHALAIGSVPAAAAPPEAAATTPIEPWWPEARAAQSQAPKVVQIKWQRQQANHKSQSICLGDQVHFSWAGSHSMFLGTKSGNCLWHHALEVHDHPALSKWQQQYAEQQALTCLIQKSAVRRGVGGRVKNDSLLLPEGSSKKEA